MMTSRMLSVLMLPFVRSIFDDPGNPTSAKRCRWPPVFQVSVLVGPEDDQRLSTAEGPAEGSDRWQPLTTVTSVRPPDRV